MSLCAKDNLKEYELPPECTTVARCYQVIDIGLQEMKFGPKAKVTIGWELPNKLMSDGKPFTIRNTYPHSWGTKARLRTDLEAWRGKKFSAEDLKGFDLRSLIGRVCLISISHEPNSEGNIWANVTAIGACPPELPCPPAINPPLIFNLDDATDAEYQALPDYFKSKIQWPQPPKAAVVQPNLHAAPTTAQPYAAAHAFYATAALAHATTAGAQTPTASSAQPIPTFNPAIEDADEHAEYDEDVPMF